MALTSTERAICEKLWYDSSGVLAPAQQSKSGSVSQISGIQAALGNYTESSQAIIDDGKTTLYNNVASVVLGDTVDDIANVITMINDCPYLTGSILSNPISLAVSLIRGMMDKIEGFIDDLLGIPEFFSGKKLSSLEEFYGSQLPGARQTATSLSNADKLINCLTLVCGGEFNPQAAALLVETEDLYSALWIVDNPVSPLYGTLDTNSLYAQAGLSPTSITKINDVTDAITSAKLSGQSSIDSFVSNAKLFKKLGSIVF